MRRGQRLALAASFALLGLSAALVTAWVEPRSDLSFAFPREATADTRLLVGQLQRGPAAGLVLLAISGAEPDRLIGLSSRLADRLEASGRFRFVTNGRARPPGPELAALIDKRYLLNPPLGAADFSAAALRQGLEATLASLSLATGMVAKDLLPADPTGRLRQIAGSWGGGAAPRPYGGVWLSADQGTALLMVRSSVPAFDLAGQEDMLDFIRGSFDEVKGAHRARLELTGLSMFATASSQVIRADVRGLTLASALFVILLLYGAFRSLPLLFIVTLPLGFGICAGVAAVQGLFGQIHGVTLAFGGILIGVAVDYPIHLISHTTERDGTRATLRKIWRTLRLGMVTTVAGFLPITVSSFPGLSQLGVFTITGLVTAALVTRWLLPAVLPAMAVRPPSAVWQRLRPRPGWTRGLRLAALVLALAAVGTIATGDGTVWETDLRNLSPTPANLRELDRRLRAQMGAADLRHLLVVRRGSMEEVLRTSEALAADLGALVAAGQVAGFDMASHYLPSLHSQRQRQRALPDRPTLRAALDQASAGLPFRPGLFEPFLDGVEQSKAGPPVTLGDFDAAGLDWLLRPLLFQQGGTWVGLIVPRSVADPTALADFAAERNDPGLSYLDLKQGSERLVADYRREALIWLALGVPIAVAMLFLGLGAAARVVRVVAPVVLSVPLTVAVLSLSGISLSVFHLLSLLLVVGIGLDYALFFERHGQERADWPPTLRANVLCAVTSVSVFTILAFSRIPVLQGIGTTVAVGAVLSLLLAFVFAKSGGASRR
jgi:predicted exporter